MCSSPDIPDPPAPPAPPPPPTKTANKVDRSGTGAKKKKNRGLNNLTIKRETAKKVGTNIASGGTGMNIYS